MNSMTRLACVSLVAMACCAPQPPEVATEHVRAAQRSPLEIGPGSITGRVTLVGVAPDPRRIVFSPGCAVLNEAGSVPDPGELVYRESGNAVPYAFVYIKDGVPAGRPPPAKSVTLTYERCRIEPRVFGMIAGQPLTIKNRDPLMHNFHGHARKNRSFNFAQPTIGSKLISGDRSFSRPEFGSDAIPVRCDVHPWETAWCHVMPHGFFDVTRSHETDGGDPSRRGTFEIRDVPPGDYVVVAWHESFGIIEQTIVVRPGIATDVQFGLDPDRSGPARNAEAASPNGVVPWWDNSFLSMQGVDVGILVDWLGDGELSIQRDAVRALAEMGPSAAEAGPALIGLLDHDDETLRRFAVEAIGSVGANPEAAVPALAGLLASANVDLRLAILDSLAQFGSTAESAVPAICGLLADRDVRVRIRAVEVLPQICGAPDGRVDAALRNALGDPHARVRETAARMMLRNGKGAAESATALSAALLDRDRWVREAAADALSRAGVDVVSSLVAVLGSDDPIDRWNAVEMLGGLGSEAVPAVGSLIAALRDEQWYVRQYSARALGRIGPAASEALSPLVGAAADGDARVRRAVVAALVDIDRKAAVVLPTLLRLADDPDKKVRQSARLAIDRAQSRAGPPRPP